MDFLFGKRRSVGFRTLLRGSAECGIYGLVPLYGEGWLVIAYAQRGDFAACADASFDCIMCGCCSSRCPAGISHPQVAELARRINGKYLQPQTQHLLDRVAEIDAGKCEEAIKKFVEMSTGDKEQIKNLYNNREIEK